MNPTVQQRILELEGAELRGYFLGLTHAFRIAFQTLNTSDDDALQQLIRQWEPIDQAISEALADV